PAHHYAPGVPLYRVHGMQTMMAGPDTVVERASIPRYFAICARCKLFDYETGEWRRFRGEPTSSLRHMPIAGRGMAADTRGFQAGGWRGSGGEPTSSLGPRPIAGRGMAA